MSFKFFIGIDVSKSTLDIGLLDAENPGSVNHQQVSNNDAGIDAMLKWLQRLNEFSFENSLFCLEHTGMYNYPLLQFFSQQNASVWVENAVQIKKSLGLQRGKNDKVDSMRIAQYAHRLRDQVKLWKPVREVIDRLKHLSALRERLVETRKRLLTPVEELSKLGNESIAKVLKKSMSKTMKGLDKDLQAIEDQMKDIIDKDNDVKKLYELVTSVVGIGFVTAVNLIVYTNEFKLFSNHRQFACYSGVAPFEYRSGSSIRGKTKVNPYGQQKNEKILTHGQLNRN
jgi:transposase